MTRSQWSRMLRRQVWQTLSQVHHTVTGTLQENLRERTGLDLASCEVLIALHEESGRAGQRALLDLTSQSQSGLSRLLNRLTAAGLVRREQQTTDRRQYDVVLTAAGADAAHHAARLHSEQVQRFLGARLSDRDAERALVALRTVLDTDSAPPPAAPTDDRDLEPVALTESVLALTTEGVEASNALAVRNALEPLVFEEAARHRTEQDIHDLHAILTEVSRGMTSTVAYVVPHWELHLRIAQITPNALLREQYTALAQHIRHTLHIVIPEAGLPDFVPRRVALHAEIVAAIADGDTVRARELATEHQLGTPGLALRRPAGRSSD